LALEFYI